MLIWVIVEVPLPPVILMNREEFYRVICINGIMYLFICIHVPLSPLPHALVKLIGPVAPLTISCVLNISYPTSPIVQCL